MSPRLPKLRLLPGCILLIAAAVSFLYPALENVVGYYAVSDWGITQGQVVSLSAEWRSGEPARNVPGSTDYEFVYQYTVADQPYRSSRFSFCHISQRQAAYRTLRQASSAFPRLSESGAVTVYYDSTNPGRSVLIRCAPGLVVYGRMLLGLLLVGCCIGIWIHNGFFSFLMWIQQKPGE